MGTRNLQCVFLNGEFRVASYTQWDGYPRGQGLTALKFLQNKMDKDLFIKKISQCSWMSDEKYQKMWVECGAAPESDLVSMDVSDKFKEKYPWLERSFGAKIYEFIQHSHCGIETINFIEFAGNSLFCEWVYVIDLDKNTFEVYKGFRKETLDKTERFFFLQENSEDGDSPVKLIKSYSLDNLPSSDDFINDFKDPDEEE